MRNPSSWIKSLSSNFTWTNRELEWYYAEDRFLFAAKNEVDCDKWVCIMEKPVEPESLLGIIQDRLGQAENQ